MIFSTSCRMRFNRHVRVLSRGLGLQATLCVFYSKEMKRGFQGSNQIRPSVAVDRSGWLDQL